MADQIFNFALGRMVEFYDRVDTSDPTNAVLTILVLRVVGIETDAVLKDSTDLADVLGGSTTEVTNGGYARIELDDTDLVAFAPDLGNDRTDLDIPDQTFTAILAGDGWQDLLICYDSDSLAGADVNIVPGTMHDFLVTPDGSDITAQIATAGFFRAS